MPVGDCERAFAQAAAADGIVLVRARVPWLNQRGHLGLPAEAGPALGLLDQIFVALGGRPDEQRAYHDALRDLVTPLMGHPPVVRIAAPERDGAAAYPRVRARLASLVRG